MFWTYLIGAIAFVLVLGVIVLIHEAGHFFFAKKSGILCHEFSIGMGPLIWQKKKGETFYSLRAIPIGGYVSMAGEEIEADFLKDKKEVKLVLDEANRVKTIIFDFTNPEYDQLPTYTIVKYDLSGTMEAKPDELFLVLKSDVGQEETFIVNRDAICIVDKKNKMQIAPANRNFTNKRWGPRFITVLAGAMMNFVLALVIFFIIGLCQGYPDESKTFVTAVTEQSPIATTVDGSLGVQDGDEIVKINDYELSEWTDISNALTELASAKFTGTLTITYKRNGIEYVMEMVPVVYVYVLEMTFTNEGTRQNLPIIGSFASSNSETKAYKAGLREGDLIKKIDNQVINTLADVLDIFAKATDGKEYTIVVDRAGQEETFTIEGYSKGVLDSQDITTTKLQLGVSPEYHFNLLKLLYQPWVDTGEACLVIFKTLGLLFSDSSVNVGDLSGPIGIFSATTRIAGQGILPILNWTAILSVNVGFINILPLPALDGGRLAFLVYEKITKKKPSPKVENIIHSIGFILLMLLFVFVAFSDILRLFGLK